MTHNQDEGMPELPEPHLLSYSLDSVMRRYEHQSYTADQMREYGRACMPAWQPIETAPMSAHPVLVFNENKRISIETGYYIHNMLHAAKLDGESCFYTHWMPLPKAPTPPQGSEK